MKLLLINQYASTPEYGFGGRVYYLAKALSEKGHEVTVVASANHHLLTLKKDSKTTVETELITESFKFVWLKTLNYKKANSLLRVVNWFVFLIQLIFYRKHLNPKADVILFSSPSLIPFIGARVLAFIWKSKLILDVRDIWPLTLKKLGNHSSKHPLVLLMRWIEKYAYANSDVITSNLPGFNKYLDEQQQKTAPNWYIPNGISVSEMESDSGCLGRQFDHLPRDKFLVGYVGTHGLANNLEVLLKAAKILIGNSNIHFVLVGNGAEKKNLQTYVQEHGLDNVSFLDSVSKHQVASVLSIFNALYIGWRESSLYEYGIAANKIPEYIYSGKPILHSYSGKFDVIAENNLGFTVGSNDVEALAKKVIEISQLNESQINEFQISNRDYALQHRDYKQIASLFESEILN